MAEDIGDNEEDVIIEMSLNCGENPNLTDLDMNRISDDINYICNDLLFLEILREENNDAKELLEKNIYKLIAPEATVDQAEKKKIDDLLFEGEDAQFLKKRRDFQISLENLSEKLDSINTKSDNYSNIQTFTQVVIVIYILFYISSAYYFVDALQSDDFVVRSEASKYNIGFVSNAVYIYLLSTLSDAFFRYNKLTATMGDLDTSVCSGLADIIVSIKSIYEDSGTYLEKKKEQCRTKVLKQMYKVYYLKYIKNIFIAAKSEFKQTVNLINNFVSKQRKFILKQDNIDVTFTDDNDAFEEFYNILLHNHGVKLFKGTKSPVEKREELSKDKNTTEDYTKYENFLKDELLVPYITFLQSLDDNKPNTDTEKLKQFMVTLDLINEHSLPEYKECLELIFPIELQEYSDFTIETYIGFIRQYLVDDPEGNILYNPNIDDYFKAVREFHMQDGVLVTYEEDESVKFDSGQTLKVMFTRIQQRRSNSSTIISKYREFQRAIRTRIIVEEDLDDTKMFKEVFVAIRQHFIELTSEYKLNENIIMRFMMANLKDDVAFEDDPSRRSQVLSNIKFIVSRISNTLQVSQKFRTNVLDKSGGINMNKYITFLQFENKMQQLDQEDLEQLNNYVDQTNRKIRSFRKYVKSEEIIFSKKFQILSIFDDVWLSTAIGTFILLVVQFTAMYGLSDMQVITNLKQMSKIPGKVKDVAKSAAKSAANSNVAKSAA